MEHQLFDQTYEKPTNVIEPVIENKVDILAMSRYEMKYVLTKAQLDHLKKFLSLYMKVDEYGKTSVASIYYDTPDRRIIRNSIEKPEYKEKIRLRSYGLANKDSKVFLELKRKVCGVVYKRRISLKEDEVDSVLQDKSGDTQISKEIIYFSSFYKKLVPAFLISKIAPSSLSKGFPSIEVWRFNSWTRYLGFSSRVNLKSLFGSK